MEKKHALSSGNGRKGNLPLACARRIGVSAMSLAWVLMLAPLTVAPVAAQEPAQAKVVYPTDRTVLPIPEPEYPHSTIFDARNATPPPRFEVKAPPNAPSSPAPRPVNRKPATTRPSIRGGAIFWMRLICVTK